MFPSHTHIHTYTHTYIHTYTHAHTHTRRHARTRTHTHTPTHTHKHTQTHTHTPAHARACTHAHAHAFHEVWQNESPSKKREPHCGGSDESQPKCVRSCGESTIPGADTHAECGEKTTSAAAQLRNFTRFRPGSENPLRDCQDVNASRALTAKKTTPKLNPALWREHDFHSKHLEVHTALRAVARSNKFGTANLVLQKRRRL